MSKFAELKEKIKKTKKKLGQKAKEGAAGATVVAATVAGVGAPTAANAQGFTLEPVTTPVQQAPQQPTQSGRTISFQQASAAQQQLSAEQAFFNTLPPYTQQEILNHNYKLAPMNFQTGLNRPEAGCLYAAMVYSNAQPGKLIAIPIAEGYYRGSSTRITPIRPTAAKNPDQVLRDQERHTGAYTTNPNLRSDLLDAINRTNNRIRKVINTSRRTRQTIDLQRREINRWQEIIKGKKR